MLQPERLLLRVQGDYLSLVFGLCECLCSIAFTPQDWEGNPTNTFIQKDASEFLGMLFQQMEMKLQVCPFGRGSAA